MSFFSPWQLFLSRRTQILNKPWISTEKKQYISREMVSILRLSFFIPVVNDTFGVFVYERRLWFQSINCTFILKHSGKCCGWVRVSLKQYNLSFDFPYFLFHNSFPYFMKIKTLCTCRFDPPRTISLFATWVIHWSRLRPQFQLSLCTNLLIALFFYPLLWKLFCFDECWTLPLKKFF